MVLERDSDTCTVARASDNIVATLNGVDVSHVMPEESYVILIFLLKL